MREGCRHSLHYVIHSSRLEIEIVLIAHVCLHEMTYAMTNATNSDDGPLAVYLRREKFFTLAPRNNLMASHITPGQVSCPSSVYAS